MAKKSSGREAAKPLWWAPLSQCLLLVSPMLVFSVTLMVLVYFYDWQRHHTPIQGLSLKTGIYRDVYYVDLSATKLITVASWSSSAVLTLMGSFLTLLSYPIAADMIWNSRSSFSGMLPSPSQLALLIDLLDGKKMATVQWLMRTWAGKGANSRSLWMIELAVALQLLVTALFRTSADLLSSVAVAGVDTWLHLSTESVTMPYFQTTLPAQAGAAYQYSRNLFESCWPSIGLPGLPCSISTDTENIIQIPNKQQMDDLLMNDTSAMTNLYLAGTGPYVYLGPPSITEDSDLDHSTGSAYPQFTASTFTMCTTCKPYPCNLSREPGEGNYGFSCPDGFSRNNTASWFEAGPWIQPLNDPYTGYTGLFNNYTNQVGLQWGIFTRLDNLHVVGGIGPQNVLRTNESASGSFTLAMVLQCNSTLGQASYSWANNSLTGDLLPEIANQTLFEIVLGPFLSQGKVMSFSSLNLQTFQTRLDLATNFTANELISRFEELVGGIGLSYLGASVGPAPATNLQLPKSTILTQVPKLPLFALVVLNLWYAVLAIALCILACFLLSRSDQGQDIVAVRELLSVAGLTRAAVSNHRNVQEENFRIGVVKENGKWHFDLWPAIEDQSEKEALLQDEKQVNDAESSSTIDNGRPGVLEFEREVLESTTAQAGTTLQHEDAPQNESQPVSPIPRISYSDELLTDDQEERRRISHSLDWADDER